MAIKVIPDFEWPMIMELWLTENWPHGLSDIDINANANSQWLGFIRCKCIGVSGLVALARIEHDKIVVINQRLAWRWQRCGRHDYSGCFCQSPLVVGVCDSKFDRLVEQLEIAHKEATAYRQLYETHKTYEVINEKTFTL